MDLFNPSAAEAAEYERRGDLNESLGITTHVMLSFTFLLWACWRTGRFRWTWAFWAFFRVVHCFVFAPAPIWYVANPDDQ